MESGHIVRAFDEDLKHLLGIIVEMGGIAEKQLADALQALTNRDTALAERVVAEDSRLDALERELDAATVQFLALRQPMADDLREVVAALKISHTVERIGDYAANLAKRATALNQLPPVEPAHSVPRMGRLAQQLIKDVLDAYVRHDAEQAIAVWQGDAELDKLYDSLFSRAAHLHDGGRAQHHPVHAPLVHRQVDRAHRRSRHQHRRAGLFPGSRRAPDASPTQGRYHQLHSGRAGRRGIVSARILIVEDEAPLVAMLRYNFEADGYDVAEAGDGEEAMACIAEEPPDLVILDWMLPVTSGLEVCRRLKRAPQTRTLPVIMLTAKGEEADRVRGLDSGADDYIAKPFSVAELLARVRAVLRRASDAAQDEVISHGELEMDLAAKRVRRGGREAHLGPTEFRLLRHLMARPGRVFSRAQLLDAVWEHNLDAGERTVDQSIRRLREALNAPEGPDLIRTVRAEGYALRID